MAPFPQMTPETYMSVEAEMLLTTAMYNVIRGNTGSWKENSEIETFITPKLRSDHLVNFMLFICNLSNVNLQPCIFKHISNNAIVMLTTVNHVAFFTVYLFVYLIISLAVFFPTFSILITQLLLFLLWTRPVGVFTILK